MNKNNYKKKLIFLLIVALFTLFLFSSNVSAVFDFNGTILFPNETRAEGVNVTLWKGYKQYGDVVISNSTLTNSNGYFNFTGLTDRNSWYISMLIYEGANTLTGTSYAGPFFICVSQEKIVNQLSNSTFYLTSSISIGLFPSHTLNQQVNATMTVIDDKLGIIVDEINKTVPVAYSYSNATITFNKARNYTLVLSDLNNSCGGTKCQVMAQGYRNLSRNPFNYFYGATPVDMANITKIRGNLSTDANTGNTSDMNYTSMNIFLHIHKANNITLYKTRFLNSTFYLTLPNGVNVTTGWFNISIGDNKLYEQSFILMGVGNDSAGKWFAGFANVTINNTKTPSLIEPINITMRKLAGNYSTGTVNASKTTFNVLNESNLSIQESVSATVNVVYDGLHILWSLRSNTTGHFSLPLLSNEPATVKVYHTSYTPKTFELTAEQIRDQSSINLSIAEVDPKTPDGVVLSNINFEFFRSNDTCNVPNPPSGCSYGVTYANKAAYKAMRVPYGDNTSVRLSQSDIIVHFKQIDTSATAAPDAQFDTSATTSTTTDTFEAAWRLGSLAPSATYDSVLVGLPYSDSDINDAGNLSINISKLYNTRWEKIWDTSINGTGVNLSLPEYADYNHTWFTGMACDKIDTRINTTQSCYVNTSSNKVWLNIPHFSGLGVDISGLKATTAYTSTAAGGSSSGGGEATTATASYWSEITANSLTSMEITSTELALTNIEFALTEDTDNARLSVSEPSTQTTASLGAPSGTVYKYLEITSSNIADNTISSATIKFKIPKSWLIENNLDKNTVALNRYITTWEKLNTRLVSEGTNNINYEAETPGFSIFAISAEKLVEIEIPIEIAEKPLALQLPEDNRIVFGAIFIISLIILVALWETKIIKKKRKRKRRK